MPSPFPGMDPYLEDPALWPGVHARLVTAAAEQLQPVLRERGYYVDINERVWLSDGERAVYPDLAVVRRVGGAAKDSSRTPGTTALADADEPILVHSAEAEIRQPFLEIFDRDGHRLVTSIEFLSPANKTPGKGRDLFRQKQLELADAGVNLVEIDLLRRGQHALAVPQALVEPLRPWHYLVSVWRPGKTDYEIYPIRLADRLPKIRIPLRAGDSDIVFDLQAALRHAYDTGPYPDRIRYDGEPPDPLPESDRRWAEGVLRGGASS